MYTSDMGGVRSIKDEIRCGDLDKVVGFGCASLRIRSLRDQKVFSQSADRRPTLRRAGMYIASLADQSYVLPIPFIIGLLQSQQHLEAASASPFNGTRITAP